MVHACTLLFIELGGSGADPPEIEFETEGHGGTGFSSNGCIPKKNDTPRAYPGMHGSSEMGYLDEMVAVAYLAHEKRFGLPLLIRSDDWGVAP